MLDEKKEKLADEWIKNRDTDEYQERAENGEKTAEDFAGQYLYHFGENAFSRFEKECDQLDEKFFEKVKKMLI